MHLGRKIFGLCKYRWPIAVHRSDGVCVCLFWSKIDVMCWVQTWVEKVRREEHSCSPSSERTFKVIHTPQQMRHKLKKIFTDRNKINILLQCCWEGIHKQKQRGQIFLGLHFSLLLIKMSFHLFSFPLLSPSLLCQWNKSWLTFLSRILQSTLRYWQQFQFNRIKSSVKPCILYYRSKSLKKSEKGALYYFYY